MARQCADWDEIISIREEASRKGIAPQDLIEWVPFLQAYARAGDQCHLVELAPIISADPYVAQQVCRSIGETPELVEPVFDVIDAQYCNE